MDDGPGRGRSAVAGARVEGLVVAGDREGICYGSRVRLAHHPPQPTPQKSHVMGPWLASVLQQAVSRIGGCESALIGVGEVEVVDAEDEDGELVVGE